MGKFSFSVITEMDPHSRPKGYPHYQWIQCEEGEGLFNVDGRDITVGPGQAMFLYPRVHHYYYPMTNPWKVHWFTFNGAFLPRILQVIGLSHSGVYSVVMKYSRLKPVFDFISKNYQNIITIDDLAAANRSIISEASFAKWRA